MEASSTLWCYEEILILHHMDTYGKNADELKNMLLQTTFALEKSRRDAEVEMKRSDENVKQLLYYLKLAYQERDEARANLQKLLNKLSSSSAADISVSTVPQSAQSECIGCPVNGNSGIAVSDSLSETFNHKSYSTSPVESTYNAVPDVISGLVTSNTNVADSIPSQTLGGPGPETDRALAVMDSLVKGKALPKKGKLMQSVMEAGPLLGTLMLSGNLPRWRNPPPLRPYPLPPFTLDTQAVYFDPDPSVFNPFVTEMSCGPSQMCAVPTPYAGEMCVDEGVGSSRKRQRCQ